eukprot:1250485-Rhodomonas_salina.1
MVRPAEVTASASVLSFTWFLAGDLLLLSPSELILAEGDFPALPAEIVEEFCCRCCGKGVSAEGDIERSSSCCSQWCGSRGGEIAAGD